MEQEKYDPYYRDFPSNLVPVRTPFTRSERQDAGQVFIYLTNMWKRWSLLLDKTRANSVYDEARQCVPHGVSQFWLVEKRYSTQRLRATPFANRVRRHTPSEQSNSPPELDRPGRSGKLLVVLREPARYYSRQGDVLSYHFRETDAIAAAETYTRGHHRRAIVGVLLWDEMWL
jgi:hypothetical protein